tara:strand:+ start:1225 stop:1542 length:318 start_codon:yes stop_codon:yes gene_type:complete
MGTLTEIKRRWRRVVFPVVGVLFVCYFVFHSFQGHRGIIAWMHLQSEIVQAKITLLETDRIKKGYERGISLLRGDQLDRDMLDERARIMAGLVRMDELIVVFPKN